MTPQGQCGKAYYMPLEIANDQLLGGFAVDLWAVGIVLFALLTGLRT